MSVEETTVRLNALAGARRAADDEIERAINSLRVAYKQVVDAARHTDALNGAEPSVPMGELADYLSVARELLAEMTIALVDLHPKDAGNLGKNPDLPSFAVDVRNGLQSKRLGKWETQALRELVVGALAGEAKAGQ